MAEITSLSATELARRLRGRELSAVEVADAFLAEIETKDETYGAYLAIDPSAVRQQAEAAQAMLDANGGNALTGVPVALKDNISTLGLETTCSSKILQGYIPPYDATVVEKLKEQGIPVLGKTNLDEFAMGASTETSAYKVTRNPWDTERTPGGSSGGSAAAVAAELAPFALGSDTGGSIRQPAALCGVVGFKPTYGRCSRYGLIAFASSLDQIGPIARNVEDAALLAAATTGHDPFDATSLNHPPISLNGLKDGSLKGLRVALPKETFGDAVQPAVRDAMQKAIDLLTKEGVEFTEISLPSIDLGVTTYYIIAPAEASSNLGRFDGIRFGPRAEGQGHIGLVEKTRGELFGHEVKSRIMIGTYALSAGYFDAYYVRAQQVRQIMAREFEAAFQEYDLVLSPTSPVIPFKLGELSGHPLAMKLLDRCTIPANMGGFPAISLNAGFAEGLPVGLQLVGPTLADESVLQAAYAVEKALPDASKRPPLS
ncbi:Asp-tRNA(Asn)/Glu-tRNA(Gln) amidotransferase subunit GatA [bacterium]|nr:MAG: Asp-tRNA(Asn)/Glu-tRNA(Gln) amidotransferase subunit GatA [bacterium]